MGCGAMKQRNGTWTKVGSGDSPDAEDAGERRAADSDPFAELGELFEDYLQESEGRFDGVVMY